LKLFIDECLSPALAQPPIVARMQGIMYAGLVEVSGERGREALVYEELQAAFFQGRPPGRPTRGWVRA